MSALYELDPLPRVVRGEVVFVALRARHVDEGLLAEVHVTNGNPKNPPKWGDTIILSREGTRLDAAGRIAPLTKMNPQIVADALLELHGGTEGSLRRAEATPEWQPPAPFWHLTPPAFPLSALAVPALKQIVQEISLAYGTPHDFAAMGVLAAISGAIGNRRRIHIVGEIYAGASLWIAVIGKPGTGKSDPPEKALAPLQEMHELRIEAYLKEKEEYEAKLAEWENAKREDRGEKPIAPVPSRLMVADHTMEGLALDLAHNPMGMVLYRDELATWLAGFDRYRAAGAGSDRANWLEIWRNHHIDVSRKTGTRVIYVRRPFVTVIGTIQPERLHELLGRLDDGFSDRLLCVYPAAQVPDLPERPIAQSTMDAYQGIIKALVAMEPDEKGNARIVTTSGRALARFKERGRALTDALRDKDITEALAGSFAKLRIYASRYTLNLHQAAAAAKIADPWQVTPEYVDAAWDLVEYHQGHARLVHAAKLADPEAARASHVLDLISRKEWASFSRRQVYMYLPTRFTRPEDADPCLQLLCDHGFIRERPTEKRTGRGRPPSQGYEVNSLWDGSVGSRNSQNHENGEDQRKPAETPVHDNDEPIHDNEPEEWGVYADDDF